MLYNSGLPLDKNRFTEEAIRLLEVDLALLDNALDEAAQIDTEEDAYITQRLAAAQFDLEKRWAASLNNLSSIENCPFHELGIRYVLANV